MLSLISPAKNQNFSQKVQYNLSTQPLFKSQIELLINKLKLYDPPDFEKVMKISENLAVQTFEKYINFDPKKYTVDNAKQALFAFSGEVYRNIETSNLTVDQIEFAQKHLLIISGLYGLIRPLDLIQGYRMEMGTKFYIEDCLLYDFWKNLLTTKLNEILDLQKNKVIINLASNEYIKAINKRKVKAKWIDIDFKEWHKGRYKTIAIYAKRARGRMMRFILVNNIDKTHDLKAFDYGGYQYNQDLSSDKNFCFTRSV